MYHYGSGSRTQGPGFKVQTTLPKLTSNPVESTFIRMVIFSRLPSNPVIIGVPLFLPCSFNKETPKQKGQKGTTGAPSLRI